MASTLTFGQLQAEAPSIPAPTADSPFRIAVLGNFGGRTLPRTSSQLDRVKPWKVDRDNFDEVMARVKPQLELSPENFPGSVELTFTALDDFHPDNLYLNVDAIQDADGREERTALMNALLHDPAFQAAESAWRGLDWFLRRVLKKDSKVEVVLFDLDFDEFSSDLNDAEDLSQTMLYRWLIEEGILGPKGQPWALIVGDYLFDLTVQHIELLGRMARLARQAAVPFLAGVQPGVLASDFEMDEEAQAGWQALRLFPEACLLGLTLPRFLLRPPYGERTRTCERFDYEEFTGPTDWKGYLWGNAAWAAGALLGLGFHKQGWAFKPGAVLELDGMPLHVYEVDGDQTVTLAETWLNRKDAERLAGLGLMPLLCVKGKDAVQLLRFQALAEPPSGKPGSDLLGRWGQKDMVQLPRSKMPGLSVSMSFSVATPSETASAPAEPGAEAAPAGGDPELDALLNQMEQLAASPEASAPGAEAEDPELAALLAQLEGGTPEEPAPESAAAPAPAPLPEEAPVEDPELAALLAQLEGGTPEEPAPESAAAPAPAPLPEEAPVEDPELAALLAQLEGGGAASTPEDLAAQVEALGGRQALEDLGWPMFVPALAADHARQLRLLQNRTVNRAVQQEVEKLRQQFPAVQAQGLLAELAALRQMENRELLASSELAELAKTYGASLRTCKNEEEKAVLLRKVREFHQWASDPRHQDIMAALEGTRFAEKWQVMLEQQFEEMGGESAWRAQAAGPNPPQASLAEKVEQLRAITSARE